jgi:sulfur-oxidizing protein SoxX
MNVRAAPARRLSLLFAALLLGSNPILGAKTLAASDGAASQDRGRALFADEDTGHCILCHQHRQVPAAFQGNIGPDLTAVGSRLSAAALRARIEDPTRLNPETVMPAYFRASGLQQVARDYRGKTILSAAQIDDLVAFLANSRPGARGTAP